MKKLFCLTLLAALFCSVLPLRSVAADEAANKESEPEFTITPVVTFSDVSGNKSKFREDTWTRDGWTGGLQNFDWHRKVDKDTEFSLGGRGIIDQRDYDIQMDLTKHDFGFIRGGFTQYPKYFDAAGGYYPLFNVPSINLSKPADMDIGRIFFEAGLTLPDMPKITFGYEHQYKDGTKSMVEWGSVTETLPASAGSFPTGSVSKKILPGLKNIDENVDLFKLGIDHNIGSLNLGDNFYFEKYNNNTSRLDDSNYYLTPTVTGGVTYPVNSSKFTVYNEEFHHDMFANTYHMDQHINDKVYWSAGYMFTAVEGGGAFSSANLYNGALVGGLPAVYGTGDAYYNIPVININEHSSVGNLNLMVGPFKDLIAYAGVQGEKTHTESFMYGNFATITAAGSPATTADYRDAYTVLDKKSVEESLGVRYTMIPYTTLYAEAKFAEDSYGQDETQIDFTTPGNSYGSSVATEVLKQQYKAGFNTSPWARMTWSTQYMHSRNQNDYAPLALTGAANTAGNAYIGFIKDLTFDTDEVSTKLTLRPCSRVSLTLKYQMTSTDIKSQSLNGTIPACQYYQNIYSMGATWTPINRLFLTGLICYQDTLTTTFDNGSNTVLPFRGNVYSVIGNAGYALDMKSDLDFQMTYSHSDNFVNNGGYGPTLGLATAALNSAQYGLPYMVSDDLTNASIGWKHRINDHTSVGVRFGFWNNHEPSSGGINDYSAYVVSASYTFRF